MKAVHKYPLVVGVQDVPMPLWSELLSVGVQNLPGVGQSIVLWARVDPGLTEIDRRIYVCGTGWDAPEDASYVGTVQAGEFVWHVFGGPA